MLSAVLETHAAVLATLDRIALLLADTPTPMESTSEEAGCVVGLEACATAHLLGA